MSGPVWAGLLLVLAFNFCLRWHLREMPLERDEGEYAYAGQLILQGIPPYQLAWNMKFPGVYFAYAALMSVFGQSPQGVHLGLILVTSVSLLLVFGIGRALMNPAGGLMASALFTLLSALPWAYGLAGHATHFVVLFVGAGTLALLWREKGPSLLWIFIAGMCFGAAILMKQHAVAFAAAAGLWVAVEAFKDKKKPAVTVMIFFCGVAVPLLSTMILLALAGVWDRFQFWTMQYARQYVSIFSVRAAPRHLALGLGPIIQSGIWVWMLGVAALGLNLTRTRFRRAAVLGGGWLLAGLAAACPGYHFRNHYFIAIMPGLALLNAVLVLSLSARLAQFPKIRSLRFLPACLFCIGIADLLLRNAGLWFGASALEASQRLYGSNPFPESQEIARYLAAHTNPDDTIAVLGSEPQIFFLAHRHSASGYMYVYPLTEPQPLAPSMRQEFKQEIEAARPRFVVQVNILTSWCSTILEPGDTRKILDEFQVWWDAQSQDYRLVGVVDMAGNNPSQFFWDEQLSSRTNTSPAAISIYRRK